MTEDATGKAEQASLALALQHLKVFFAKENSQYAKGPNLVSTAPVMMTLNKVINASVKMVGKEELVM